MPVNEEMKADLDAVTNLAKRMGFKGKDASDYIHEHMTRLGYKSRRSYYKDEGKTSNSSGFSFFGGSRDSGDDDE